MNLRPIGKRVVVKPDEHPVTTKLGLYVVHRDDDRRDSGTVLAVASDVDEDIQVGDTVIYAKYAGSIIEWDGESVVIQHQSDVLAVMEAQG